MNRFLKTRITRKPINHDRLLSVIALLTGVAALYFSWEANQISRRSISPNVVAQSISADPTDLGTTDPTNLWVGLVQTSELLCTIRIRLSNLGGMPTAIVGHQLVGDSFEASRFESIVSGMSYNYSQEPSPPINRYSVYFVKPESIGVPLEEQILSGQGRIITGQHLLPLPIEIDAGKSIDIYSRVFLAFDHPIEVTSLYYVKLFEEGNPADRFMNYMPVKIGYVLYLATGETIFTEQVPCFYYPKQSIADE